MSIDLINFIGEKFVTCTAEFDFRSRLRLWNFNELKGRMGNWFWISWFDDQRSKIWFRLLNFSLHLSIRVSFESHVFSNDLRFQIFIHQHKQNSSNSRIFVESRLITNGTKRTENTIFTVGSFTRQFSLSLGRRSPGHGLFKFSPGMKGRPVFASNIKNTRPTAARLINRRGNVLKIH